MHSLPPSRGDGFFGGWETPSTPCSWGVGPKETPRGHFPGTLSQGRRVPSLMRLHDPLTTDPAAAGEQAAEEAESPDKEKKKKKKKKEETEEGDDVKRSAFFSFERKPLYEPGGNTNNHGAYKPRPNPASACGSTSTLKELQQIIWPPGFGGQVKKEYNNLKRPRPTATIPRVRQDDSDLVLPPLNRLKPWDFGAVGAGSESKQSSALWSASNMFVPKIDRPPKSFQSNSEGKDLSVVAMTKGLFSSALSETSPTRRGRAAPTRRKCYSMAEMRQGLRARSTIIA